MTYQLHMGLSDEIADAVRAYAEERGISIAAAVRIMIHSALAQEKATE